MQIAQVMSGYSLGGADLLRRAMGKKKPEEMAKQRASFQDGAANNNIEPDLAAKIFDLVEKFAGYGFNKSHSAAYALVSYQTLWLKAHYPAEFMAAVMSADMDNTDKIVTLVDECSNMGLTILPPDLNAGQYKFTVNEHGEIVYGIGAIKGVGEGPVEAIIQAREQQGKFDDLFDFCAKVDVKKVNKRVLEKLVLAGAMDTFGTHRASLLASIKNALDAASQQAKNNLSGQTDLFGLAVESDEVEAAYAQVAQWSEKVRLDGEKETLGLYLTGHPINQYLREVKHYADLRINDLKPTNKDNAVSTCGLVLSVRVMVNKKGRRWGIVTLDDKSGRMDVRFYPDVFEQYESILSSDQLLWVSGQVSFDEFSGQNTINARDVMTLMQAREKYAKYLSLKLPQELCSVSGIAKLQGILQDYSNGTCPLRIQLKHTDAQVDINAGAKWYVQPEDQLLSDLSHMLGAEQVELIFN
jgi:DNA polymerase-3 subunit alpha